MDRERVYSCSRLPAGAGGLPHVPYHTRARRPGQLFQPLERHIHWHHFTYFRLLVVTMACRGGRRNVANVDRYLEAPSHRTRVNTFLLVERWDPEAVLRQTAQELLRALHPKPGATISLVIDDSKKAKRGSAWTRWSR
jgi:DDE superfamily endonuclease